MAQQNTEVETTEDQFQLGLKYFIGESVPKDEAKALPLIQKAAELGDDRAQHLLGVFYANGECGLSKDSIKATEWFQKSSAQGNAKAQVTLGVKYAKGDGVNLDLVRAYAWFSLAAAQGNDSGKSNSNRAEKTLTREQLSYGQQLVSSWKKGVIF